MAGGKRGGKRAGPRRPSERSRLPIARLLLLALGVTLTAVAWGYLVVAAIDFGTAARSGESRGWLFLAAASLGAVACLFTALILLARAVRLFTGRDAAPAYESRHAQDGSDRSDRATGQSTSGTRRS
ncbi:hypothetical protein [uncultured Nocardioides sp.]|uniref:hypothetical protein n=1 Tax=uncultured Nocardioides sp. TaxID=198441 RepID=UPI0026315925|nr:hypothetical protein [uncultured Nocardioides sp.]